MQPLQQLIATLFVAAVFLVVAFAEADEDNYQGANHVSKPEEAFERMLARAIAKHDGLGGDLHGEVKRNGDAGNNHMAFWKRADDPSAEFWRESNFWKRSGAPAMFWKRGAESAKLLGAFRKYLGTSKRFGDMMAPKDAVQRRQEDVSRPEFNPTGW